MSKKTKQLYKYPVTYKGEVYEVRFECEGCQIYKKTKGFFGTKYSLQYSETTYFINEMLSDNNIREDSPTLHIEQIKMLFKLWEINKYQMLERADRRKKAEVTKQNQKRIFEEWDGVIDVL